ncbi:cytidine deaminase [Akkermansiaceae bacterium]|nr:cytidine deaminase [Akkermansiaceae bacterium]MDB4312406.1 cytidine deaminase [bacterium]MDA7651094.1 cytidine deaminase [Akkermansiaceae bacterium]MDA7862527.1 cytidine deaminase [Akkermansiaceae bacterium]MDA7864259.1 cytidine deaminase [Akkermansiaceae bacterium]
MTDQELITIATEAKNQAYAPYSKFHVGAAILGKSGKVYPGCNVENASYGLTNCAERVAIGVAISSGEKEFEAIAISVKGGGSPCGACRQVLNEFAPNLRVIMADEDGQLVREMTLNQLLPEAFGPKSLS